MIYRLKFDRSRFLCFDVSPDEWLEKLGPRYLFQLDERDWSAFWPTINGQFFNDSDGDNLPKVPDISVWFMQNLVLNEKARALLQSEHPEWAKGCGELLALQCEGIDYSAWHSTHIVSDECIDQSKSQRTVEESGHIELQALAFKADAIFEQPLFHCNFDDAQALFCTQEFKYWAEKKPVARFSV